MKLSLGATAAARWSQRVAGRIGTGWIPYLFVMALPFFVFWRLWSPNDRDLAFLFLDVTDSTYPRLVFMRDVFVHYQEFPKWAWGVYSGIPWTGTFANLLLYPPHWLFFVGWIDPANTRVYHVYLLAHLAGAGATFYALARSFGHARITAVLGASVYSLCGYTLFVIMVGAHWGIPYTFLPLTLLSIRRFVLTERLMWVAGVAGAVALVVSSLNSMLIVPMLYCVVAFAVFSIFVERKTQKTGVIGLWIGFGIVLGIAVHAVELLPIWEFSKVGNGFGIADFYYARDKYGEPTAIKFFKEYFLGAVATPAYLGTLGGIAALVGLVLGRGRYWGYWAALFSTAIVAFFCSRDFALYDAFYLFIPLVNKLPALSRGGPGALFVLGGAFLAMSALDRAWVWRPRSVAAVLASAALGGGVFSALLWMIAAPAESAALLSFKKSMAAWLLSLGGVALLVGAMWSSRHRRAAVVLVAAFFVVDVASVVDRQFQARLIPWQQRHVPQELDEGKASNAARIMLESPYLLGRAARKLPSMDRPRSRRPRDMVALIQGPDNVEGYLAYLPRRTVQAFAASGFADSYIFRVPQPETFDSSIQWPVPTVLKLYDLPEGLGRAWVVPSAIEVRDPPHRLMASQTFDPALQCYLEQESAVLQEEFGGLAAWSEGILSRLTPRLRSTPRPTKAPIRLNSAVSLVQQTANTVTFQVERATQGETLIFSDSWYPGWAAYVNGVRVPLFVADYLFKGVKLSAPAGTTVEFVFDPPLFRVGAAISATAILVLVVLAVVLRKRTLSPPQTTSGPENGRCHRSIPAR